MIFDETTLMSDAQAITASAVSTNYIDLGAAGTPYGGAAPLNADVGKGNMVPLLAQVVAAFAALTSLDIIVEVDDNTGFASAKTVYTQNVLLADLVAGKQINIDYIPKGTDERYLRMRYNVNGVNATAGAITAGVTMGNQTNN